MRILGISCFYHDAAACLVEDGRVVAAAEEERFTRRKHDAGFPHHAVRYCLAEGGVGPAGPDAVAFYDKPLKKFHRILESHFAVAPRGLGSFLDAVPVWVREKLWIEPLIREELERAGSRAPETIHFLEHHEAHAASAFFPSPFEDAAILTEDGVGEWACAAVGEGEGHRLRLLQELDFPHSPGLLYSAFTYFTGFRVNSGEYKMMGLAPYGEPKYVQLILDKLVDLKADGSFRLAAEYFGFLDERRMTNDRFAALFGGPERKPESPITRRDRDIARSAQEVCEEILLRMARHVRAQTGRSNLCLAGGVALNCVANGRLLRAGVFDDLWIQPAAGDAGGAVGAALALWHEREAARPDAGPRVRDGVDAMNGAFLGPEFSPDQIRQFLDAKGAVYERVADADWARAIAQLVADQKVVGLFQGRMEFGPRALGARSILGDARSPKMQSEMNLKIKFRESFRPFAPAVPVERVSDWFDLDRASPYMLLTAQVRADRCLPETPDERALDVGEWVNRVRSQVPAITHVDRSARVQTVDARNNPKFHAILAEFERLTGCPVMINTSFNTRGEPIVCTPQDAWRCFHRSRIDHLVLGPFVLDKARQPTPDPADLEVPLVAD